MIFEAQEKGKAKEIVSDENPAWRIFDDKPPEAAQASWANFDDSIDFSDGFLRSTPHEPLTPSISSKQFSLDGSIPPPSNSNSDFFFSANGFDGSQTKLQHSKNKPPFLPPGRTRSANKTDAIFQSPTPDSLSKFFTPQNSMSQSPFTSPITASPFSARSSSVPKVRGNLKREHSGGSTLSKSTIDGGLKKNERNLSGTLEPPTNDTRRKTSFGVKEVPRHHSRPQQATMVPVLVMSDSPNNAKQSAPLHFNPLSPAPERMRWQGQDEMSPISLMAPSPRSSSSRSTPRHTKSSIVTPRAKSRRSLQKMIDLSTPNSASTTRRLSRKNSADGGGRVSNDSGLETPTTSARDSVDFNTMIEDFSAPSFKLTPSKSKMVPPGTSPSGNLKADKDGFLVETCSSEENGQNENQRLSQRRRRSSSVSKRGSQRLSRSVIGSCPDDVIKDRSRSPSSRGRSHTESKNEARSKHSRASSTDESTRRSVTSEDSAASYGQSQRSRPKRRESHDEKQPTASSRGRREGRKKASSGRARSRSQSRKGRSRSRKPTRRNRGNSNKASSKAHPAMPEIPFQSPAGTTKSKCNHTERRRSCEQKPELLDWDFDVAF